MSNNYSTYQVVRDSKNKVLKYAIIPFEVEAFKFKKQSFDEMKSEYDFLNEKEAIYILYDNEKYYIGESSNVKNRLQQHSLENKKDFWVNTFVITSMHLNNTTRKYFENWLLNEPDEISFGLLEKFNKNNGNSSNDIDDLYYKNVHNNFEKVIIDFFKIIESEFPIKNEEVESENATEQTFEFKGLTKRFDGKLAVKSKNEFYLLKGSILSSKRTEYIKGVSAYERMLEITENPKMVIVDEYGDYILQENLGPYKRPTFLADLVCGGSVNGWDVFKDTNGNSLDVIHRRPDSFEMKKIKWKKSSDLIDYLIDKIIEDFDSKYLINKTTHYWSVKLSDNESKILFYIRIFSNSIRIYTNDSILATNANFNELEKIHWGNANWSLEINAKTDIDAFTDKLNMW